MLSSSLLVAVLLGVRSFPFVGVVKKQSSKLDDEFVSSTTTRRKSLRFELVSITCLPLTLVVNNV